MGEERTMTSETDPIFVDFVPRDETVLPGLLSMTFAPGMKALGQRGRWDRNLEADLRVLRDDYGTDTLVSVMEEHEYHGYGIPELFEQDLIGGIEVLRFAIEDMNVPKEAEAKEYEALIRDVDRERRLVRYRGKPQICNHCPAKPECTDSDEGREVVRAMDPWPHSEAGRFHREISLSVTLVAALILAAELVRNHGPSEIAVLGAALAATATVAWHMHKVFRASPANFPAAAVP